MLLLLLARPSSALERVVLRDGMELVGDVTVDENRVMVAAGPRMIIFGSKQLLKPEPAEVAGTIERFTLKQPVQKKGRGMDGLGRVARISEFDDFARRTVTFIDSKQREVGVYQAITEIYPTHVVLMGLNRSWRMALAMDQVAPGALLAALNKATDPASGNDRLRVLSFLIAAERFNEAKAVLAEIKEKHKDVASQAEELSGKFNAAVTQRALMLARKAISGGQLQRGLRLLGSLEKFAVPGDLQPKLQAAQKEIEGIQDNVKRARELLTRSRAAAAADKASEIGAILDEIVPSISIANLVRLQPMLALADQATTKPADRLALAISGWTLGPDLASQDVDAALKLWQTRQALRDAMEATDDVQLHEQVQKLSDGGVKPDLIVQMTPLIPAPPTQAKPGEPFIVKTAGEAEYSVLLPPEYDRYREYPAVIALHGLGGTPKNQLAFWATQSAEHGLIVVAPHWRNDPKAPYSYSVAEHTRFFEVLSDARRRFAIDADRVFVCGHELGGFAAWDFAASHPDQFAGLISFSAVPMFYAVRYTANLAYLPIYAVEGEFNGAHPEINKNQFTKYFDAGNDAIYVEYPGRGGEMFLTELPTICDWMSRKRRRIDPSDLAVTSCRLSDRRFFWLQAESFLANATVAPELFNSAKFRAAKMQGKVTEKNMIFVTCSGLKELTLLLSPKLVHLDDPKLIIRVNQKQVHRGKVEPDLETLVREVRRTGDRKALVVKKIQARL